MEGDSKEGPIMEKDLDLAIAVVVRGTMRSRRSRERRGQRDEAERGGQMLSGIYLGATPSQALRTIRSTLYSMQVEIGSQWRCSLMKEEKWV